MVTMLRVQRHQRNRYVRRTYREAALPNPAGIGGDIGPSAWLAREFGETGSAEYRMVPVVAGQGAAKLAAFAQTDHGSADLARVPVKPAAYVLGQVAPNSGHVTDMGCGYGVHCVCKQFVFFFHYRGLGRYRLIWPERLS